MNREKNSAHLLIRHPSENATNVITNKPKGFNLKSNLTLFILWGNNKNKFFYFYQSKNIENVKYKRVGA